MARLFRRDADDDGVPDGEERGGVATRTDAHDGVRDRGTRPAPAGRRAGGGPAGRSADGAAARDAALRRRDEFGGMNLGAAFFGWLVAIGMAVIVTSILAA